MKNKLIKEVSGLRCIGILMVIFFHLPLIYTPKFLGYHQKISLVFSTQSGVELFFVIAGYFLMCSLSRIESYENKVEAIINFIGKKFKRLAPAAYFWIGVTLFFCLISNNSELWHTKGVMIRKFLATIIWFRNFEDVYFGSQFGYFWALSLEFQFFIIFTIIYFYLGKKKTLYLSIIVCIVMLFYRPGVGTVNWCFRFDSMLYGVILYYLLKKTDLEFIHKKFKVNKLYTIGWSFLLTFALASIYVTFAGYPHMRISLCALICSVMLLLALSNNSYFYLKTFGINKIIDWIASRSYSLYCCHIVSWYIVRQIYVWLGIEYNKNGIIYCIILMIFSAEFSYRYIENLLIEKKV